MILNAVRMITIAYEMKTASDLLKVVSVLLVFWTPLWGQTTFTDTLFSAHDSLLDIYRYQIPSGYDPQTPVPLLVGWHQWGGDQNEFFYTQFAAQAEERGWLALASWGGHHRNWTNQQTQRWMELILEDFCTRYAVDPGRIYMVGGSMGGASGMIYANNHLDPAHPMVAATASASGILDDHRRFLEQGNNNSMIEVFGGTPDEVPFIYHRNSAIYFADSLCSMHSNLKYLPVYLTYGANETYHQYHALDLYAVLTHFNAHVYIGTTTNGHGWGVFDVPHVCDWLSQFTLVRNPDTLVISADENSVNYWTGVRQRSPGIFSHYAVFRDTTAEERNYDLAGLRNVAELALLDLPPVASGYLVLTVGVSGADSTFQFSLVADYVPETPFRTVLNGGEPLDGSWPVSDTLSLQLQDGDQLQVQIGTDRVSPPAVGLREEVFLTPLGENRFRVVSSTEPPLELTVFDLLGRRVLLNRPNESILDLSSLPSGMYVVRAAGASPRRQKVTVLH